MPPPVEVPEFVNLKRIADGIPANPGDAVTTHADDIWACWEEIDSIPDERRSRLADHRVLSSPAWESDAGQLSMVLKALTLWSRVRQLWLVVPADDATWRFMAAPQPTTCDYAVPCQQRPQVRRRLVGAPGCCRKAKHVAADASSIIAFAADTRIEFQTPGRDIVFAVNDQDLKSGAFPRRA